MSDAFARRFSINFSYFVCVKISKESLPNTNNNNYMIPIGFVIIGF
jgi:hypothetical protein